MRRIFKISLLLLLIQPLLFLNVYAEEIDMNNTTIVDDSLTEDITLEKDFEKDYAIVDDSLTEDITLERDFEKDYAIVYDIVDSIPNYYNVDYTEEDSFSSTSIEEELRNQIMNILGNDWNTLVECGYSLSIYLDTYTGEDDFSIHQYSLFFQHELDDYSIYKTVNVAYSNSIEYSEDDYTEINEVYSDEEINYTQYVDFYTNEIEDDQISFDDYMNEYFSSLDVHYYYESLENDQSLFSEEDSGYTYIFKNELFYKLILTRKVVVSRMNIIDLVTSDDVLNEIQEKVEENCEIVLPENDISLSEDYEVYSEELDSNFGIVEVQEIEPKEEKNYSVLNQSNYSLEKNQTQSISFKVNCIPEKFIKLLVNQVDISSNYYSFLGDEVVVTLKNEYISLLDVGTYSLLMVFSDGVARGQLKIWEEEVKEVVAPVTYDYYDYYHYDNYNYYSSQPVELVVSETKIIENEPSIESKEQITSIGDKLIQSEDKDIPIQIEEAEDKKEKKKFQFNRNYIPIIIVVVAFIFGLFGGVLYKKSLED